MPKLVENKTVTRRTPQLTVTNAFKAGRYVFQLMVEDNAGNKSRPVQIAVTVRGRRTIDPRIANPRLRINRDRVVRPVRRNPTIRRPR